MSELVRSIVILGSTGSIGRSTLEVLSASSRPWNVVALTAHSQLAALCEQAVAVRPHWVIATDEKAAEQFDWSALPHSVERLSGQEAVEWVVRRDEVDIVVSAMVGSVGLRGTWAALDAGKTVALANKETLVMAGAPVMELAAERGAAILPIDSEHSAVFQALQAGRPGEVKRIILTASGGPFRNRSRESMATVTPKEALDHPNWDMGQKITIDSATMMNKALEIIEARWLFDLPPEKIDVVIHPQSIVHSMVEFTDGAVLAQLSPPDMKLPIQYALTYPERCPGPASKMDFQASWHLDFEPPDLDRFPSLQLGYEVAAAGGTAGAVMNAANEAAVYEFLNGTLGFLEIVPLCRSIVEHHHFDAHPSLDELLRQDRWARQEVRQWICS